jgi:uncharacterized protein (UPF0333 family)
MDLLEKVVILIVILVAVSLVVFWATKAQPSQKVAPPTKSQVEQFVYSYLSQASPGAQINIINATQSTIGNDSWDVFVGIVYNATSPCPTVVEQDYNYPAINLAPRYDNNITAYNNGVCTLYSGANTSIAGMNLPAIAQVKSYIGSQQARTYVKTFGYNNTHVQTQFLKSFNYSGAAASHSGMIQNVWQVNYTAKIAAYSYYTILNDSGNLVFGYTQ